MWKQITCALAVSVGNSSNGGATAGNSLEIRFPEYLSGIFNF
jgi:hypothetical protein